MKSALLTLNAGSSSVRCALYDGETVLCRAHVQAIGTAAQRIDWRGPLASRFEITAASAPGDHAAAIRSLLRDIGACLPEWRVAAVGHRVVHGGEAFARPVIIDARVEAQIALLVPLAPNHQPHNLAGIRAVATAWPQVAQVACFDTAFHHDQPALARRFALPRAFDADGIRRYGFHGLSYEFLAGELPRIAGARADGRVILAHLGHGASLCALRERNSIATTMGFSALDGLMMGTRCGSLDPGVLLHLLQSGRWNTQTLGDLLYNRSGLLGVSGISDDVRELERSIDPRAREALDLFAYRAVLEIGAMAAAIGGLDVLVFSAGIGENSASMRAAIGERCAWLGVTIDPAANAAGAGRVSADASSVDVFVVATDEELVIARAVRDLLGASPC